MSSRGQIIKDRIKKLSKKMVLTVGRLGTGESCGRILTYHSIGIREHEMNVTPSDFEAQMNWLKEKQISVRSVEEILSGEVGIALTFDDGYVDNLTHALPILKMYNFPATVFVVAGKLGETLEHDEPNEASRLMQADELVRLSDAGIEIGAHTLTHPRLAKLKHEEQRREIVESVDKLAGILGKKIKGFAYPYGSILDYDVWSKECVAESGCTYAVSNRFGPVQANSDPWAARRIWIDASDSLTNFQCKVLGKLDGLWVLDSKPAMFSRRILNSILGT